MIGGFSGIGKLLGLLADLIRGLLRARRLDEAQSSYDAIESDPAGEFIDRYGVRSGSGRKPSTAEADAGER